MAQIFVVYSGRPAGEVFDREVHVCLADSAEQAIQMCQIDTSENMGHEWLWGPHAKSFEDVGEAIRFAGYRAEGNPGEVFSFIEAHGFNEHDKDPMANEAIEGLVMFAVRERSWLKV